MIHDFKVMNQIKSGILLTNQFNIPDRSRTIVTPTGALLITGGYMPLIDLFCKNTFILEEHRSMLIGRKMMITARADHGLNYHKGRIYAIGGISAREDDSLQSLTSCEIYNVEEDHWSEMLPLSVGRSHHSVCTFNDKFLFVFGGRTV